MSQRAWFVAGLGVVSLFSVGCMSEVGSDVDDGNAAEARAAQLPVDPDHDFIRYRLDIDNNPLFDILIIGPSDIGSYTRNTEYWYVHDSNLGDLGTENISVTATPGDGDPPSLSGDQEFTQPVYLTWQSFSTDPVSSGALYGNSSSDHYLRVKEESGEIVRVTWYQIIDNESPENVAPSSAYSPAGTSVSVPSGDYGYYIDATIP